MSTTACPGGACGDQAQHKANVELDLTSLGFAVCMHLSACRGIAQVYSEEFWHTQAADHQQASARLLNPVHS
jgi:hypothetical protein